MGVRFEVVDGFLHPSFNLHLVSTFRGSCSDPNFQNIPIRDKLIGKLIRSCFIPRKGHVLDERDYSALEFRICACWWNDKNMVKYASDPSKDIHRDMAAECYLLPKDHIPKNCRFYAKSFFVFPTLYGSYYVNTARNLWGAIATFNLQTEDGVGLYDWLQDQGINNEKDFENHIKKVEQRFNEKFPEWSKKKEMWLARYSKKGFIDLMTGFRVTVGKGGLLSRNNLYNTPIQGPAFHILLWSLIQLVKRMKKMKMRSVLVGQIHDSIMGDIHRDEWDEYSEMSKDLMTVKVREHFDWIVTPLEIEAKISENNWFDQKTIEV
jgi:DNA polymerase-1